MKDIGSIFPISSVTPCRVTKDTLPRLPVMRGEVRFYSLCREIFSVIARGFSHLNRRVAIPAYTCDTVFNPFIANGWTPVFYGINRDFTIDLDSLSAVCHAHDPDLVIVHPFYGNSLSEIEREGLRALQRTNRVFIEDLTQSIFDEAPEDIFDYAVASLRKWLPMPDGAFLASSRHSLDRFAPGSIENTKYLALELEAMKLRGDYYDGASESIKTESRRLDAEAVALIESSVEPHALSAYSRAVLSQNDFAALAQTRRANYNHLHAALKDKTFSPRLPSPLNAPLYYPILLPNRAEVITRLIPAHIYAPVLWPVTNPAVLINDTVRFIYDQILCLPVDQRYTTVDMNRILEIIHS